jgi:hypothetical protein
MIVEDLCLKGEQESDIALELSVLMGMGGGVGRWSMAVILVRSPEVCLCSPEK